MCNARLGSITCYTCALMGVLNALRSWMGWEYNAEERQTSQSIHAWVHGCCRC